MGKVEITAEEYVEYLKLRQFYRDIKYETVNFSRSFFLLKDLAFQSLSEENATVERLSLIAEKTSLASTDYKRILTIMDSVHTLIKRENGEEYSSPLALNLSKD